MKKKGFTLIELLAVIVVLAFIAIIAVPKILGVVETARREAAIESAKGYVEAVNNYITLYEIGNPYYNVKLKDGTYQVSECKNCDDLLQSKDVSFLDFIIENVKAEDTEIYLNNVVKTNGRKPRNGYVIIRNKRVVEAEIVVNGYAVKYTINETTQAVNTEILGKVGTDLTPPELTIDSVTKRVLCQIVLVKPKTNDK